MARPFSSSGFVKGSGLLIAGASLALALPAVVFASGETAKAPLSVPALPTFMQFTPAGIDPGLVRRAEAIARSKGLSFTPAGTSSRQTKSMTVAVRVDDDVARIVNVRGTATLAVAQPGTRAAAPVVIAPTRYDLGIARGYQSFAKPVAVLDKLTPGARKLAVEDVPMADLSTFTRPAAPAGKPSRFSSRVALQTDEDTPGRTPRTLNALGQQSVDVSGSYRVLRNLDVTAGVRLSQDRDRLAPLTDAQQDDKAVYVGTQFKF